MELLYILFLNYLQKSFIGMAWGCLGKNKEDDWLRRERIVQLIPFMFGCSC